jgi:hypothetical protein
MYVFIEFFIEIGYNNIIEAWQFGKDVSKKFSLLCSMYTMYYIWAEYQDNGKVGVGQETCEVNYIYPNTSTT